MEYTKTLAMFLTVIYEAKIHRQHEKEEGKKKMKWNKMKYAHWNGAKGIQWWHTMRKEKKAYVCKWESYNTKEYWRETEWGAICDNKWSVQQTDWMGSIGTKIRFHHGICCAIVMTQMLCDETHTHTECGAWLVKHFNQIQ